MIRGGRLASISRTNGTICSELIYSEYSRTRNERVNRVRAIIAMGDTGGLRSDGKLLKLAAAIAIVS